MLIPSMLRVATTYGRGERPRVEDMEELVIYVRHRCERGLPAVPAGLAGLAGRFRRPGDGSAQRWLQSLQERKLRRTVEYVYHYVPFYRQAMDALGLKPADIRSLADLRKLPITRREHLAQDPDAFISRYPGLLVVAAAHTGGTTGTHLEICVTSEELRYYAAGEALTGLVGGWLGPAEIMQTHFTVDDALEAMLLTSAARLAGTLVLTCGQLGTLDEHLESLFRERHLPGKKPKVSWLMITPSHLWALTRRAEELGYDFQKSGLTRITTGGAMVSEDLKQRVLKTWGIALTEGYGLTETFTYAAAQCPMSASLHFSDVTGYAEVLDPDTEEAVPPGQPGVLVITMFYPDRELMPLLRYWTDDVIIMSPDQTCACGLPTSKIQDIIGRVDHMVKLGGTTFYPQEVGDSLLEFRELVMPPRFTLRAEQREDAQYAVLDVEVQQSLSTQQSNELRRRIEDGINLSHYWQVKIGAVKLEVNLCPAGSLEHPFAYKHRHLVLAQGSDS